MHIQMLKLHIIWVAVKFGYLYCLAMVWYVLYTGTVHKNTCDAHSVTVVCTQSMVCGGACAKFNGCPKKSEIFSKNVFYFFKIDLFIFNQEKMFFWIFFFHFLKNGKKNK